MPTNTGWKRLENTGTAGQEGLGIQVGGDITPYVFGIGATNEGRIATTNLNGAAITVPDAYGFGEMIELRWTFAETGNSQRQGIFVDARTSAANSSTIRGAEIGCQSEGAIAVGVLEGANISATVRSTTTGNITDMFGVTGEVKFNSSAYTGTVANAAAVRGKISMEDGATYTASSAFLAEAEAISGADVLGSLFRGKTTSVSVTSAIDVVNATLVETNSGKNVTLMRWTGANGTVYSLVHDTDAATAVSVIADS